MKKLKIKSPLNLLILLIFLISIIYTIQAINKDPQSLYSENTKNIEGIITKCQIVDNKTQITLKSKEKILVNYYDNFTCILGTKIKVKGNIFKSKENTIFNLFNYQKYLYSQKIYYQMAAKNIENKNQKISKLYKIKNDLNTYINTFKSKEYLNAFLLGNTKEIDKEVISSYRANGISHLLAISGMHITLISTIFLYLLNHLFKYKKVNYLIVILILIFYMFLTNFTPSVVRATLLFISITIKNMFKLKIDTLFIIILICALCLFYNPYIVYNIGFQFSFIITFFLILFSPYLKSKQKYLNKIFIISLISFLVSIPILINNFFEINILSPIINIIFIPIVSLIIYPMSLLTLIIKPLDSILVTLVNGIENLSLVISNISIFKLTLRHISMTTFVIYYWFIFICINNLTKNKKSPLILLIIVLLFHHNINYLNNEPYITVLDVGQGDSILISLDHNKGNILIDTGGETTFNKKTYNIIKNKTIPYLKSEGINKLNYLILTHGDFDHMGEAKYVVEHFKVDKVILNCGPYNDLENELIRVLDKNNIKHQSCINELKIDKNKLYFLQTKEYDNENDNSM